MIISAATKVMRVSRCNTPVMLCGIVLEWPLTTKKVLDSLSGLETS